MLIQIYKKMPLVYSLCFKGVESMKIRFKFQSISHYCLFFLFVVATIGCGPIDATVDKDEQERLLEELRDAKDEHGKKKLVSYDEKEEKKHVQEQLARVEKIAEVGHDEEKKAMAVMKPIMIATRNKWQEWKKSDVEFVRSGGAKVTDETTVEELQRRLSLLTIAELALAEAEKSTLECDKKMEDALKIAEVHPVVINNIMNGYRRSMKKNGTTRRYQLDRELLADMRGLIELLIAQHGEWHADYAKNSVVFSDANHNALYDERMNHLIAVATEMEQLKTAAQRK